MALVNACVGCTRLTVAIFEHLNSKATSSLGILYPSLVNLGYSLPRKPLSGASEHKSQRRLLQSSTRTGPRQIRHDLAYKATQLPRQCSGCGAFSQTSDDREAGFYSLSRTSVRAFLSAIKGPSTINSLAEGQIIEASRNVKKEAVETSTAHTSAPLLQENPTPLCDRCHKLLHHRSGVTISHPSIESIQNTILESPHKYNHIYHVIDAADFPMSLIPRLHHYFHLAPQRSLNRRSKTGRYYHGKKTEVSFIIARSDLLAPLKAHVDSLMPYLVSVLRDALGSNGKNIRLGNVKCVSAKRGWWTKELKEIIWSRGGGGWMVGKVNVGKSQLFENVFPKGRCKADKSLLPESRHGSEHRTLESMDTVHMREYLEDGVGQDHSDVAAYKSESLDSSSLLPPLPPETDYPAMPLVSALPGTTASPIRVPFGNGKGELVDLPGLARGDLELLVQEPYRSSLIMRSRVLPEQQVIKPGQSLLLGGIIRITPVTPEITVLAYSFTPILSHLTSTEKAISIQTQERETGVQNISKPGVGAKMSSAGRFPLKWDVTKQRSGPVTGRSGASIKADRLPYRVVSTDILIEGCGWVELVAQVRKRELDPVYPIDAGSRCNQEEYGGSSDLKWPEVEVFSPEGKFIGNRRPLGAWMFNAKKKQAVGTKGRPRRSMKGMKKKMKAIGTRKS